MGNRRSVGPLRPKLMGLGLAQILPYFALFLTAKSGSTSHFFLLVVVVVVLVVVLVLVLLVVTFSQGDFSFTS